jgi:hypothetical protein
VINDLWHHQNVNSVGAVQLTKLFQSNTCTGWVLQKRLWLLYVTQNLHSNKINHKQANQWIVLSCIVFLKLNQKLIAGLDLCTLSLWTREDFWNMFRLFQPPLNLDLSNSFLKAIRGIFGQKFLHLVVLYCFCSYPEFKWWSVWFQKVQLSVESRLIKMDRRTLEIQQIAVQWSENTKSRILITDFDLCALSRWTVVDSRNFTWFDIWVRKCWFVWFSRLLFFWLAMCFHGWSVNVL